jgi:thiamine biosynthesis protein ThiS
MEKISIYVNGKPHLTGVGVTVDKLLEELGYQGHLVAVAVNEQCILRREYSAKVLEPCDAIEILTPMAGG